DNAVNSTTGTILLKATFENKNETLWPGSFAMATVTLGELRDAIVAPSQAVQRGQQGQYVFVVKQDGTVESRSVTVSLQDERQAVIEKGLAPGEVVVTDGQLRLAPGSRVQVKGGSAGSGSSMPPRKMSRQRSRRHRGSSRRRCRRLRRTRR